MTRHVLRKFHPGHAILVPSTILLSTTLLFTGLSLIFPRSNLWAEDMRRDASDETGVFVPAATPNADTSEAGHETTQSQKKKDDPLETTVKRVIASLSGGDVNALSELTALPSFSQDQKLHSLGLFFRRYFSSQLITDRIELVEIKRTAEGRAKVRVKVFRVPVNAPRSFSGTGQPETWSFIKKDAHWFFLLEKHLLVY